jgi:tetratricopeptide (TPR) repeat protein
VTPTAPLYVLAANTWAAAGNVGQAEALLKKAIELDPDRLTAYGLLGGLYARQNRLSDARDQFRGLVEKDPRSVQANTMLGLIMEAQKDLPAAEAQYEKTLAIDANAAVAANNLAWLYVSSNRNLDQALQLASAALKALPNVPQVNDTIGWIYHRKGQSRDAIRHLEIAAKGAPADPGHHYHLGMAYLQAGEIEKGRKALQQALAISPSFEGAAEARKALEGSGLGDPEA